MKKTPLDRCVEVMLQVFGAFAGFALIRFITASPPGPLQKSPDLWWLVAALAALLLRYMLGSAVHLNGRFVTREEPPQPPESGDNPNWVTFILFFKDVAFLVALGCVAVFITMSQSIDEFIFASKLFVGLGAIWCVVDLLFRMGCYWKIPSPYKLEIAWFAIDAMQFAFLCKIDWFTPNGWTAQTLVAGFAVFLFADVSLLISKSLFPRRWKSPAQNSGFLVVRAEVADTRQHVAFDNWYKREHLPLAMAVFGAEKAWRFWSKTNPTAHQATYQFADRAAAEAAVASPGMNVLVAEFDRRWPGIPRTREIFTLVDER